MKLRTLLNLSALLWIKKIFPDPDPVPTLCTFASGSVILLKMHSLNLTLPFSLSPKVPTLIEKLLINKMDFFLNQTNQKRYNEFIVQSWQALFSQ